MNYNTKQWLGAIVSAISITIPICLLWIYATAMGKWILVGIATLCLISFIVGIAITTTSMEVEIRILRERLRFTEESRNDNT